MLDRGPQGLTELTIASLRAVISLPLLYFRNRPYFTRTRAASNTPHVV